MIRFFLFFQPVFPGGKIWFLLLLMAVLISSCTYHKNTPFPPCTPMEPGRFEVLSSSSGSVQDIMNRMSQVPKDPAVFGYRDMCEQMKLTQTNSARNNSSALIYHEAISYRSTDNNGNEVQLSGLLIYPWSPLERISAPIVSVNHGTQLMKKYGPSQWKYAQWSDWENFPEMAVADLMAAYYGWIVIMPDYQGMGFDTSEVHPYCINERLANATADMVEAAEEYFSCAENNIYVGWNKQTFLYGYSEGGFVTMAAARELEERKTDIAGVVCMDGPYDLSGTMLNVMLSNDPFPVPYFLPMMLVGYHAIYPTVFDYSVMLKEPYRTDIPKYTNGFYDNDKVISIMPQSKVLKDVFTPAFLDTLQNKSSLAYRALYDNNSYVGWTPKSKMLIWHCQNDDCVPFGNYVAAKQKFSSLGLKNIEYVEWPAVAPEPGKTIHVSVAPRAFYEGSLWIFNQTK
ncbi:MAG: hypothetical protein WCO02_16095 [Bacteroidota bacterium]